MKRSSVLLGVVPVLWMVVASITISAAGRFSFFDPDYYYLLSSLDLALRQSIGMFHHPGTTGEIFGAAVIRIAYLFQHTPDDVQTAVLKDPESFLAAIHVASALLNGLALLVLGVASFNVTKNVWLSMLLQLSPFVSSLILIDTVGRFKAEPFILFACLLFLALVVVFIYSEKTHGIWLALAFAAVCGFGLATKFTFVPVVVIPALMLPGAKQKMLFLAGTALATVAFTLPIVDRYAQFGAWISNIAFHNGLYGQGSAGIVDVNVYTENFAALLSSNVMYVVIVLFAVFAMTLTILGDYQSGARRTSRPAFKALYAIVFSQVIGFVLVAKYYFDPGNSRYLFTSYCLLGLTLVLSVTHFLSAEYRLPRIPRYMALAILAVGILPYRDDIPKQLSDNNRNRRGYRDQFTAFESRKTFLAGEDFKHYGRIVDLWVRTAENGLFQAASYSLGQREALQRIYPNTYFCSGGCNVSNWKTRTVTGFDVGESWSGEALMARHGGKIVLIYIDGATPALYVVDANQAGGTNTTAAQDADVVVSSDVDSDGKAMLLWRNTRTGHNIVWLMNGPAVATAAFGPTIADVNWEARGTGDFDGDARADIIWRNRVTGENMTWLMKGTTVANFAALPTIPDTNWEIVGTGDLSGDGKTDVILRNKVTGQNVAWLMNGATVALAAFLPGVADTNWQIVGVGDVDADGKADVIWHNKATGQNIVWRMNGVAVAVAAVLPTMADTNWEIAGVGDLNGDHTADVVLRNKATGRNIAWLMNGTGVAFSAFLLTMADTDWEITSVGDRNGDGKADVIWRNKVNGQNRMWLMNGTTVTSSMFLPTIADTSWNIAGR
jgi:FG-GAP-like repeat